jgi:hypothetical protein
MAYYSRHECGGVVAAVVDMPEHKADVAKEVSKMIRQDGQVLRANVAKLRAMRWCACFRTKKEAVP